MRVVATVIFAALVCATAMSAPFSGGDAYAAARDAERAGHFADAIAGYDDCVKRDSALAGYAHVRAALCRARSGDAPGAVERLRGLASGPDDDASAWFARAELAVQLHRQGAYAEAAALLGPIVTAPIHPKWLDPYTRTYGDSLIAQTGASERAKGFAVFAAMLAEARTRSQRLEAAHRLANSPDPRQRLDAVYAYVNAGEWASADAALTALDAAPQQFAPDIAYLRARVKLATDNDKEAGRSALLAVAKDHSDIEAGRLALEHAARSYFTAGREPEKPVKKEPADAAKLQQTYRDTAAKLFGLMTDQLSGTKETGDALWWLAHQHLDRDDDPAERAAALVEFQRLVKVCPDHERAAAALFEASTLLRSQGDAQTAAGLLRQIVERYPSSDYAAAAAFGCGQARRAQGDRAGAAKMFQRAVDAGGVGSFYAHRASQCLAELDSEHTGKGAIRTPGIAGYLRPIAVEGRAGPADKVTGAWLDRMRFFASHGCDEAEWEVLAHAKAVLESEQAAAYLAAISEAGLAATVDRIISQTRWGMSDDRPVPEALPALYPRAYWPAVQATARETGADPMLLLAIARQESLFQARIESPAGATGVMQLMPSTAAWIAKTESAIGPEHLDNLDNPESSLRLGGYYYRYILGRQGGNTVFAIASYNAGPGNVSKWRARYDATDLDAFIEAIPFEETRDFVKKVLGNLAAYHSIYPERDRLAREG